ncbi:MAG: ABC transporter substrate-binding protein [Deltaproteobacteria bacterium]|nr:ABC transporter substrate-binding protein [Deltaproteobacteria bacterium]
MAPRAGILLAAVLVLVLIGGAPSVSHGQVKLNVVYIVATNAEIQALELLTSPEYQARYGDYRKKYGIEITVKAFMAAGDKYNAIKAGAVDMDVNFGVLPLAVMVAEGIPVRGVALASKADYMIVVRKESPITRIEEFRGKPFGVTTLSGTGYYITDFAFRAARIDVKKDLQLKALPGETWREGRSSSLIPSGP